MAEKNQDKSWPLVGNDNISEFLSRHIIKGTAAGAYIFSGPAGLGKKTLAYFFAQSLLCQKRNKKDSHPCGTCPSCKKFKEGAASGYSDLYTVEKEDDKKNISIDRVRDLIKSLSLSSFLDSYKIGIIDEADTLSEEAGNALLKTLEEPKDKVIVILLTSNIEILPATIVSRSRLLRFAPVETDKIYAHLVDTLGVPRTKAKHFAHLAGGRPALAVKFFEDSGYYDNYLKQANTFLDFFSGDINDRFLAIEALVGKKLKGQVDAAMARDIIDVWRGVARDMLLIDTGQIDLLRNDVLKEMLEKAKSGITGQKIAMIIDSINRGDRYLAANVNPKLALEEIAVTI